jgi:hypothetical protein
VSDEYGRPRRRRGGGCLTGLLVFLLIVAGLLFLADRVAANYAERQVADRVAAQLGSQGATADRPDVTIHGVPFLTQVAKGDYRDVTIVLRNLAGRAGGDRTVRMPLVDIAAHDVRAPLSALRSGTGSIVARSVHGAATLDYASVAALMNQKGLQLSDAGGKLGVKAPVQILGRDITVTGTADVVVQGQVLSIRFQQLTAEELAGVPAAQQLLNAYARNISVDLRVPALPFNLVLKKVQPTPQGLQLTADATNVPLSRGGSR